MSIRLITGGARSGKSRYAQERARALGGDRVSFLATARPVDAEMRRRIRRHQIARPAAWQTLEVSDIERDLAAARHPVVLLDCLTLLLAGAIEGLDAEADVLGAADAAVDALLHAAAGRDGELLVVTNEVGLGVVPATPLGRWFRDAQGDANRRIAEAAESVVLLVSGVPCEVKGEAAGR